jgi:hypothetical protein
LLRIAIVCFVVIAVPTFYAIRLMMPSSDDGSGGGTSSRRVRFLQKWKDRRRTERRRGGMGNVVVVDAPPAKKAAPSSVANDAESRGGWRGNAGDRNDRRESRHASRYQYVPKYPPSIVGYDIYDCPYVPPVGYPRAWKASEVLGSWPPRDVDAIDSGKSREVHQGLCLFDYAHHLDRARSYRDAELPFVIRGDPNVMDVVHRWEDDDDYLMEAFGMDDATYKVERSPNVNFMWYRLRGGNNGKGMGGGGVGRRDPPPKMIPDFVLPPNDEVEMTYGEWLEHALVREGRALHDEDMIARATSLRERRMILKDHRTGKEGDVPPLDDDAAVAAAAMRNGNDDTDDGDSEESKRTKYYYFRVNANLHEVDDPSSPSNFLYDELPFLDPRRPESEFYIVDPKQQRGINCRFGMRGVTAANHFDMSRNTIAVLGGERRYVLASPSQCDRMGLYPVGHPSVRHSSFDWGDPYERAKRPDFEDALLHEVVLHGGDVLYLPTNWFHFIVNLSLNYQCNARSGTTFETADVVGACGFKMRPGDFRVQ